MAIYDIQPGTPLTTSLGDPSNPTPIFAQYGFLPNDCATLFCKAMHLERIIKYLGYDFKDLLFQTETGEIAPKVSSLNTCIPNLSSSIFPPASLFPSVGVGHFPVRNTRAKRSGRRRQLLCGLQDK